MRIRGGASTTIGYEIPSGATVLASYVRPVPGASDGAAELVKYLSGRMPNYMVPQAITLLDALPVTPAGKLDRAALPEPVLRTTAPYRAPRSLAESALCSAFAAALGVESVGIDDSFFELGGNSLLATRVVAAVRDQCGLEVPIQAIFLDPTPAASPSAMGSGGDTETMVDAAFDTMLPIRPAGAEPPLFCVHSVSGVSWPYAGLLAHLGADRPVVRLAAAAPDRQRRWPRIDRAVGRALHRADEEGSARAVPTSLLGWSLGGLIAYEMAAQLTASGDQVAVLALLDSRHPGRRTGEGLRT